MVKLVACRSRESKDVTWKGTASPCALQHLSMAPWALHAWHWLGGRRDLPIAKGFSDATSLHLQSIALLCRQDFAGVSGQDEAMALVARVIVLCADGIGEPSDEAAAGISFSPVRCPSPLLHLCRRLAVSGRVGARAIIESLGTPQTTCVPAHAVSILLDVMQDISDCDASRAEFFGAWLWSMDDSNRHNAVACMRGVGRHAAPFARRLVSMLHSDRCLAVRIEVLGTLWHTRILEKAVMLRELCKMRMCGYVQAMYCKSGYIVSMTNLMWHVDEALHQIGGSHVGKMFEMDLKG